MSMPATRHRFTLDDYYRMYETGVLREDQRLELLDGEIYEMAPTYPPHASIVDRLARLLITRLGTRAIVRVQGSVSARPSSQPQPDLAVLAERADFYRRAHPEADDVHLLIEVSDTTLSRDRAKLRLYATAGMQEVWIVNIDDERIEVYRSPDAGVYIDHAAVGRGERLLCPDFPDVVLTVDEVFG